MTTRQRSVLAAVVAATLTASIGTNGIADAQTLKDVKTADAPLVLKAQSS
jgi:hypothetical protein